DITFIFFFFQAEDGIRDRNVTGVQTCALPIYKSSSEWTTSIPIPPPPAEAFNINGYPIALAKDTASSFVLISRSVPGMTGILFRSEERRVGKECRSRGVRDA